MASLITYSSALDEFQHAWLPQITDSGLDRLIELLASQSPLLIHGAFTKAMPMGCLASHIAWHHPKTEHRQDDAGVCWLSRIAGLNPATSRVILDWDRAGNADRELVANLLGACKQERELRLTQLCDKLTYGQPEACVC
jgi:hypothetical protein